ncbi:hypothetical protein GJ744_012261 [Endocarpon pusillum]|uniref:Uncharacterized protein n=1 Tax=Endocarpon pusillum TaxID=364733 RepID=A0A8H7E298_9EURO|nr:hypothetical protein GJ744_012261 [Endocarpon pusillum]
MRLRLWSYIKVLNGWEDCGKPTAPRVPSVLRSQALEPRLIRGKEVLKRSTASEIYAPIAEPHQLSSKQISKTNNVVIPALIAGQRRFYTDMFPVGGTADFRPQQHSSVSRTFHFSNNIALK